MQAYLDVNRDLAGPEAIHLTGYTVSTQNNVIHETSEMGWKSTVGPYCMLGDGSTLGERCSIKRSVVGRHCRIGSNVKIINSVVMNYVTVEDGSLIQNSIICSNVILQERSMLKDCQVSAIFCPLICLILLDEIYPIAQSFAVLVTIKDNLAVLLSIFCLFCLKSLGSDCRWVLGMLWGPAWR
jgi:NDP-sugar pyrophosphorylase family protein